jgi:hypothetical protein
VPGPISPHYHAKGILVGYHEFGGPFSPVSQSVFFVGLPEGPRSERFDENPVESLPGFASKITKSQRGRGRLAS